MSLSGKIALVTGASRGIGRGIALELAKEGAFVIINYKNSENLAKELQEEIKAIGALSSIYKCDVANYKDTKLMIENIIENYGAIDILVNNAGISKVGLFMDFKEEDFDDILNTNLKSIFNTCNSVVKHMISRGTGNIINISSIWGNVGASCEVLYSASKGAINSFTRALAKELGPSNIRVNAIAPGVINTEMNKWLTEEEREELVNEIPMMKMGETEDIGKAVAFLCSSKAKYITGQILTIDGAFL